MQRHILTVWLFQNNFIYSPTVHGQLILSSLSLHRHWQIHISVTWMSHISCLHSKRVNHGVANLVNLPVYSLLSGITLFRAHGKKWVLSRVLYSPVSLTACMAEYANHAYWRKRRLLLDLSAFGYFGRMVWQRPALLDLAAQMLPFKYSVDFKSTNLAWSCESICHCVLSLDHVPEMKGHLDYIWNRTAIAFICCSYALLHVKLHPICTWLFCTSVGNSAVQYAIFTHL